MISTTLFLAGATSSCLLNRYQARPLGRACSLLGDPQAQRRRRWLFWPPVFPGLARNRGQPTNTFPTEGAKVGLLLVGAKGESNKNGVDEAGTGG